MIKQESGETYTTNKNVNKLTLLWSTSQYPWTMESSQISESRNSQWGNPKGHGRFKANVTSEAYRKLGVSSRTKGVGGG